MSVPAWPSDLPRPSRADWQRSPQNARRKRAAETGPPGYRRRFSASAQFVSLQFDFSRAERSQFERFYYEDTAQGATPFTMVDPTTDGWKLLDSAGSQLITDAGTPILLSASWLCLFGDDLWSERHYGVRFKISVSIVVLP